MMNSIAPFWDGNETWLVLGGGGLFAAFPLAYAVMMPALYIPVIIMLLGLIFRGVAFEFRFKATDKSRRIWDDAFHFGSLVAAFMQGVIIGAVVQGIKVEGRSYAGGPFDWLDAYSIMTGVAGDEDRRRNPALGPQMRMLCDRVRGGVSGDCQHQHADHECGHKGAVV
jgi:cytochrome d ubiquinol oxidase subunit II